MHGDTNAKSSVAVVHACTHLCRLADLIAQEGAVVSAAGRPVVLPTEAGQAATEDLGNKTFFTAVSGCEGTCSLPRCDLVIR